MDMSGFALTLYVCCSGICIPTIFTSSVFAIVSLIPKIREGLGLTKGKLIILLVSIFIVTFILTWALALYLIKDFYVM